jgi:hypothetical protein
MRNISQIMILLIVTHFLSFFCVNTFAAISIEEWRKTFDNPKIREANQIWLSPGPELEKKVRESAAQRGVLPKDPAHADKYVKELVAFQSNCLSVAYENSKINVEAARSVIANPDFHDSIRGDAYLLLYIDNGDITYLKKYLLSSETSPNLFLRVHDPAVLEPMLEIVSEAYRERVRDYNMNESPGKSSRIIAESLPAVAGMMYFQEGGNTNIARQLFRDLNLFSAVSGNLSWFARVRAARTLHEYAPLPALEDFLYILYQNGEGQELVNIKNNASPELIKIVDKVGERYRSDVQKMFEQVKVAKPKEKTKSTMPKQLEEPK